MGTALDEVPRKGARLRKGAGSEPAGTQGEGQGLPRPPPPARGAVPLGPWVGKGNPELPLLALSVPEHTLPQPFSDLGCLGSPRRGPAVKRGVQDGPGVRSRTIFSATGPTVPT